MHNNNYIKLNGAYYKLKTKVIKNCRHCLLYKEKDNFNCFYFLYNVKEKKKVPLGFKCFVYADNKLIELKDKRELLYCKLNKDIEEYKLLYNKGVYNGN